jgi:hypothetical protein
MTRSVLIISYSPIARDPRVMRQIQALQGHYNISVVGLGPMPTPDVSFFEVEMAAPSALRKGWRAAQLLTRCFESAYWRSNLVRSTLVKLKGHQFDLVVANDVIAVPVALRVAVGSPVLFDAHEYSPKEFENSWVWRTFLQRYMTYLCTRYLPKVRGSMTVCAGIAEEYRRNFGISALVVYNSPKKHNLFPILVDQKRIRLIHHGIAARARQLELMIELMAQLDQRFTLDLMLVNSDSVYLGELKKLAEGEARIRFREPVPMEQISVTINDYDVGLFLLPPVNLNYKFALPNKFFEFIQARLAVVIGPSPEMARLVEVWKCGAVASDFEPASVVRLLNALTADEIYAMKENAALAAEELHAGVVTNQVLGLVADLLQPELASQ